MGDIFRRVDSGDQELVVLGGPISEGERDHHASLLAHKSRIDHLLESLPVP